MGHDDTAEGQAEEHRLNFTHGIGISVGLLQASKLAMEKAVNLFTSDSREADSYKAFAKELKRLADEARHKAEVANR